jgi:hypothetical protein
MRLYQENQWQDSFTNSSSSLFSLPGTPVALSIAVTQQKRNRSAQELLRELFLERSSSSWCMVTSTPSLWITQPLHCQSVRKTLEVIVCNPT